MSLSESETRIFSSANNNGGCSYVGFPPAHVSLAPLALASRAFLDAFNLGKIPDLYLRAELIVEQTLKTISVND